MGSGHASKTEAPRDRLPHQASRGRHAAPSSAGSTRQRSAAAASRRHWKIRHQLLFALTLLTAAAVLAAAPSLVTALTRPGTDTVAARFAEWARTHGFASAVTLAERIQYDLHPPKVGGKLAGGLPVIGHAHPAVRHQPPDPRAMPMPAAVPPLVHPALRREGQWTLVDQVAGFPAIAATTLRPDALHTSYYAGLVWMNPRLLTFALHPGYEDPGAGSWGQQDILAPGQRAGLLAAFNSGFRLYAANGGYYSYGHKALPLRTGAASVVIYRNGSATIGEWGRDVRMTPQVVAVRQNLDLIVDHGRPVPGLNQNVQQDWGATLGNLDYVWRSGIGVTAAGALVYAAGKTLSVSSLARLLQRAGCVRAMELDINPEWTQFVLYHSYGHPADPSPRDLLPDMQQPASRYYLPTSRDFFSVYAKPASGP